MKSLELLAATGSSWANSSFFRLSRSGQAWRSGWEKEREMIINGVWHKLNSSWLVNSDKLSNKQFCHSCSRPSIGRGRSWTRNRTELGNTSGASSSRLFSWRLLSRVAVVVAGPLLKRNQARPKDAFRPTMHANDLLKRPKQHPAQMNKILD